MAEPSVTVILCTYYPDRFFCDQLASIAGQTLVPAELVVSDDSGDAGVVSRIVDELERAGLAQSRIVEGPGAGFAANFLSALSRSDLKGDYFAFSDQDDIWFENKLEISVGKLMEADPSVPALFCGRTLLVDEVGAEIGLSAPCRRLACFRNALVQSLAGGNTMVLNAAARDLIRRAGVLSVVSHDWWIYMLVTGAGGRVIFDDKPLIRYRQHDANIIGANNSLSGQFVRVKMLFRDRYKSWNDINEAALEHAISLLLPENRRCFELFRKARSGALVHRLWYLWKSGVFRQTLLGSAGLVFATITGKI
jgi:glycosyltransferase involved in cell wall biosynthesis